MDRCQARRRQRTYESLATLCQSGSFSSQARVTARNRLPNRTLQPVLRVSGVSMIGQQQTFQQPGRRNKRRPAKRTTIECTVTVARLESYSHNNRLHLFSLNAGSEQVRARIPCAEANGDSLRTMSI